MRFLPPITLITQAWTGDFPTRGNPVVADCVIGFSFGYRGKHPLDQSLIKQTATGFQGEKGVKPGLSNQDLASVALRCFPRLPKILQFEIADAYKESAADTDEKPIRIEHHRRPHRYLDTLEVAQQAQDIMKQHSWKKAVILAHPNHMPRVVAVCQKLGIDCIVTRDTVGAVEFDLLSSQKWTRSLERWHGYEPLCLYYFRLKGWI